jgi:hypothetical protein
MPEIKDELAEVVLVNKSLMEEWRKLQEQLRLQMEEESNKVESSLRSEKYDFEKKIAKMEKLKTDELTELTRKYEQLQLSEAEQKDENTKNDTLVFQYLSAQQEQIPFSENFEPSQALQRWSVNGDSTNGWEKAASGFRSGESITAKNFRNVKGTGSIISPRLNWLSADSLWLEFQVAAGYNPGLPADTLEVSVSFDCGINWKAVYRQSSREMAMNETSKSFLPTVETDWKLVRIDLSDLSYKQNEMLIRFTNKNLGNNNIYVDQVKVYPLDVSSTLKEKGFRLLPNPVKEKLYIQFYPNSGGLESIHVSDIAGRTQYFSKMDG